MTQSYVQGFIAKCAEQGLPGDRAVAMLKTDIGIGPRLIGGLGGAVAGGLIGAFADRKRRLRGTLLGMLGGGAVGFGLGAQQHRYLQSKTTDRPKSTGSVSSGASGAQQSSEESYLRDIARKQGIQMSPDMTPGDIAFAIDQNWANLPTYKGPVLSDDDIAEVLQATPTTAQEKAIKAYIDFIHNNFVRN